MTTETSNVDRSDRIASLSVDTVFDLLHSRQRRDALTYLSRHVGAVPLDELVAGIASREELTPEALESIASGFHHVHLPKLIETAVVRYEPTTRTIERRPAARCLDPFLDLATLAEGDSVPRSTET
ncbi:hypothetical protein [Haloterrigena salinisoli]|uniref:DUF7344 domain-containing protein n=1 Tax=Haloterrigena salinisoli TaxID=3132747 RepID=UPI0030CCA21B